MAGHSTDPGISKFSRCLKTKALGVRSLSVLTALPSDRSCAPIAADVRVRTLGRFAVTRDGQQVPIREWQSRKARELLKMLVARRGVPATREMLGQTLWPGATRVQWTNRLSVALSTIRGVLDPYRLREPDHFISTAKYAVTVTNLAVDIDVFLADADHALSLHRCGAPSLDALESAAASYHGDFLAEDLYADWAVSLREEAKLAYLRLVRTLALSSGDHDRAVRYWRLALTRDAYDEQAHRGLISSLTAGGRHGEATRHYVVYANRMAEIGVAAPIPAR